MCVCTNTFLLLLRSYSAPFVHCSVRTVLRSFLRNSLCTSRTSRFAARVGRGSGVGCRVSGVGCRGSRVGCRASGVGVLIKLKCFSS